ncbi:MAG: nucleotide exchange factor GrpE [Candidatus Aureabacteria bacterium]|nr:nucleotide exchange factor GrpE [Candidatus Auribacterota bacterium]
MKQKKAHQEKDAYKKNNVKESSDPMNVYENKKETDVLCEEKESVNSEKDLKLESNNGEQNTDYLDHLQRLQAEFDNFRKRTVKEKQMFRNYILEEFVANLLPVLDNFGRAMASCNDKDASSNPFIEGVKMIYTQFVEVLKGYGVEPIKAIGEVFDPAFHEAVGTEESISDEHTILKEVQTGFKINERVIRPSAVIVAKNINNENSLADEDANESSPQKQEESAD